MVHKEKVHPCNLVGFKGKVNTLLRNKGKVRSFAPSLLINSLKFSPSGNRPSLGRTMLHPRVIIYTLLS